MSGNGNFFAVDRRAWRRVCQIGLNEAVTYLVLARGTGWDNLTTAWSVHAVEKWTGISRARARAAHDALAHEKLIAPRDGKPGAHITPASALPQVTMPWCLQVLDMADTGKPIPVRPPARWSNRDSNPRQIAAMLARGGKLHALGKHCYERAETAMEKPDWIWLPNSLVTGAAREVPPVELLRQGSSVTALRLLVDLYSSHALRGDGGVHWRQLRQAFDRRQIGEQAQYRVYAFTLASQEAWRTAPFVKPYMTGEAGEKTPDTGWPAFWSDLAALRRLGLFEYVPHLIEADTDTAEILHPLCSNGDEAENLVSRAAIYAGGAMLNETGIQILADMGRALTAPCPAHIENVALVGIGRLRYKPKTRATAAWQAKMREYQALAAGFEQAAENTTGTEKHVA